MRPASPCGPGIVATVTYLHASQMVSYSRLTDPKERRDSGANVSAIARRHGLTPQQLFGSRLAMPALSPRNPTALMHGSG